MSCLREERCLAGGRGNLFPPPVGGGPSDNGEILSFTSCPTGQLLLASIHMANAQWSSFLRGHFTSAPYRSHPIYTAVIIQLLLASIHMANAQWPPFVRGHFTSAPYRCHSIQLFLYSCYWPPYTWLMLSGPLRMWPLYIGSL